MADGSQVPVRSVRVGLIEGVLALAPKLGDRLRAAGYAVDIAASSNDACFDSRRLSVLVLNWTGASHSCLALLRRLRCKVTTRELFELVQALLAHEPFACFEPVAVVAKHASRMWRSTRPACGEARVPHDELEPLFRQPVVLDARAFGTTAKMRLRHAGRMPSA